MTTLAALLSSNRQRLWYAHVGIIVTAEFAAEASRGLVLPTLFSYAQHLGGDLVFMGLLTSLFSAGRFASSLLLGILSDRVSFKTLYHISAMIGIVGNVLYVLPYSRHVNSKALLGLSRFVIGFGAGNRSVCRANIAALTRLDQRTSYFTLLATVVFLAYALTPGLGGIFGDIDFFVRGSEYFPFNQLTAPGYLLVALNLLAMAVNALVYDESVTRNDAPVQDSGEKQQEEHKTQKSEEQAASSHSITTAVVVCTVLNFNARGILSIFETVNVPLYLKALNQTSSAPTRVFDPISTPQLANLTAISSSFTAMQSSEAIAHSCFFLMIGLLGLVSYGAVIWLGGARGRVSDTDFLLFGFGALFAGNAGLFVVSSWLTIGSRDHVTTLSVFLVAEILVWSVGCPIASAVIVPAFSKALGTRPQGKLMGVFGASASISRMLLPFLPGVLPSWELLFLVNMALCLGSIVLWLTLPETTNGRKATPLNRTASHNLREYAKGLHRENSVREHKVQSVGRVRLPFTLRFSRNQGEHHHASRRISRHAFGPIIAVACLTSGLVIAGIVACARMDAIWRSAMEAAKVEHWLPLAQTEWMVMLVLLLPVLSFWMCGLLVIADHHRLPRKRELVAVTMLGVAVVGISAVGFSSLARNGCPQDSSIAVLFADKSAVDSYNQHTCVARCLGTTSSTIASSGENDDAAAVVQNCARTGAPQRYEPTTSRTATGAPRSTSCALHSIASRWARGTSGFSSTSCSWFFSTLWRLYSGLP